MMSVLKTPPESREIKTILLYRYCICIQQYQQYFLLILLHVKHICVFVLYMSHFHAVLSVSKTKAKIIYLKIGIL